MRRTTVLTSLALSLSVAIGCGSGAPGHPEQQYPQGLTILTQSAKQGLSGVFMEGRLGLRFDTAREVEPDPSPGHAIFLADGTPMNVDVQFTDLQRRNVATSVASHSLPAKWQAPPPLFKAEDAADRAILFRMVRTAAASIAQATLTPEVSAEQARIAKIGQYAPAEVPKHAPPATAAHVRTDTITGDWGPGNFYQYFEVRNHDLSFGEHSATRWYNCESTIGCGGWFETCNHGTCAGDLPGLACNNVSPWHDIYYDDSNVPSCDTWGYGYSTCGFWTGGGSHNCNDDSMVQMHRIICDYDDPGQCQDFWGCPANAPDYCGC
jgi:hypothetical protein